MFVNQLILASNPFLESYSQSDLLGKLIFLSLYLLSMWSWTILISKIWMTYQARRESKKFYEIFQMQKLNPLSLNCEMLQNQKRINPFLSIYEVMQKQARDLLNKNRHFASATSPASLSLSDLDFVAAHLSTRVANEVKDLEKHLYILSTAVSLAPFLGLLGTVWGILLTFSAMQSQGAGQTHQAVLSGLSLALATTVLGLLAAIPALIGYNYLKNTIRNLTTDMEGFSTEILASIELQYRKVDG